MIKPTLDFPLGKSGVGYFLSTYIKSLWQTGEHSIPLCRSQGGRIDIDLGNTAVLVIIQILYMGIMISVDRKMILSRAGFFLVGIHCEAEASRFC